jgi:hypothetical protein
MLASHAGGGEPGGGAVGTGAILPVLSSQDLTGSLGYSGIFAAHAGGGASGDDVGADLPLPPHIIQ